MHQNKSGKKKNVRKLVNVSVFAKWPTETSKIFICIQTVISQIWVNATWNDYLRTDAHTPPSPQIPPPFFCKHRMCDIVEWDSPVMLKEPRCEEDTGYIPLWDGRVEERLTQEMRIDGRRSCIYVFVIATAFYSFTKNKFNADFGKFLRKMCAICLFFGSLKKIYGIC